MDTWNKGTTSGVEEGTLKAAEVQVERKTFRLTLKENPLGKFVRVTEMGTHCRIIPTGIAWDDS